MQFAPRGASKLLILIYIFDPKLLNLNIYACYNYEGVLDVAGVLYKYISGEHDYNVKIYFQAFINEAESLLNSSSLALDSSRYDLNKSTGYTPSVIGTQEVYRYNFA